MGLNFLSHLLPCMNGPYGPLGFSEIIELIIREIYSVPAHCSGITEFARAHASDYNRAALLALGCTPALNLAGSLGPRENHELHSNCPFSSPLASPFLSSSLSISSSAASTGVVGRWCGGGASTARYCISSSRAPHARAFRQFLR